MPIYKNENGQLVEYTNGGSIAIDSTLSATSENAIMNKVVTTKIDEIDGVLKNHATTLGEHETTISSLNTELSMSTLVFSNISISTTLWTDDITYTDYPKKADIPCEGVTTNYVADVIFGITEAFSNNYAPVTLTGDGVVTIYAKEVPSADITIPTIKCEKVVSFE